MSGAEKHTMYCFLQMRTCLVSVAVFCTRMDIEYFCPPCKALPLLCYVIERSNLFMFAAIFDPFIASLKRERKKQKKATGAELKANVLKRLPFFQLPPFLCQVASCLVFEVNGLPFNSSWVTHWQHLACGWGRLYRQRIFHLHTLSRVLWLDSSWPVVISASGFSLPVTLSRDRPGRFSPFASGCKERVTLCASAGNAN